MKHPTVLPVSYRTLVRELARNLERYIADDRGAFCGEHRVEEPTCVCLRDRTHAGRHRCLCGVEWEVAAGVS